MTDKVQCIADYSHSWTRGCCLRSWWCLGDTTKWLWKWLWPTSYFSHPIHNGQVILALQMDKYLISYYHVWCGNITYEFYSVAARFPYLMKNNLEEGDEGSQVIQLDWRIIEGDIDKPFVSSGLEFVPLPVRTTCCEFEVMLWFICVCSSKLLTCYSLFRSCMERIMFV